MIKRHIWFLFVLLLASVASYGQTTVTGHVKFPDASAAANAKICFSLQNFKPNSPRVLGTGTLLSVTNFCITPAADGSFSTNLYGNNLLNPTATNWRVDYLFNGVQSSSMTFIINHSPFNLDTESPVSGSTPAGPNQQIVSGFPFTQLTPSTTWTIVHNLNDLNVQVYSTDINHHRIYPDTETETDPNTVILAFVSAQAGFASITHIGSINIATTQPNAVISNATGPQTIGAQPVSFQGPVTSPNINGLLAVDGVTYASIAAAQTAAGSNRNAIAIPPSYAGGDCPSLVPTSIWLDFRGSPSSPLCSNNVLTYNFNTAGNTNSLFREEMTVNSIAPAGSALVHYFITHYKNGTNGNVLDGVSTEAALDGTFTGTLPSMTGNESVSFITSSGGTVTLASGGQGYCQTNVIASPTALTECRGLDGVGFAASTGAVPGNAYGLYGRAQTAASVRNYSVGVDGLGLLLYNTNFGAAGFDCEDAAHATHRCIYVASDNSLNLQAVNAVGLNLDDSTGAPRVNVSSSGLKINAGTALATSNQTGSGNIVLATAPTITNASLTTAAMTGPTIGGGSTINKVLLGTATLTYTAIAANTCQEQPFTLTGALTSGVASASPTTNLGNVNLSYGGARVSATDTMQVKVCNVTTGSLTPTAVSWNAMVTQ